ncbi:hypothetical protein [Peribacillus frigoritolerans]|uniref:hypothetical protein n=1 Tax=Peribacillus frigoritolerans TaxID=450367 RepID=UPI00207AA6E7|nr:hypothetical protein [Peribacillus frigoritolerans]USK77724.1 hypothetical protein LIT31_26575 [Peribacillus frigoritolerans]USK77800.1 hypothetical protein LIT31_26095 [Peribacillus frigoritolerans]USK77866.1 hypothetical protein LIT31_27115 [Peribacillus frigoritolerans]
MEELLKVMNQIIEGVETEMKWQKERIEMMKKGHLAHDKPDHYERGLHGNQYYLMALEVAKYEIEKAMKKA